MTGRPTPTRALASLGALMILVPIALLLLLLFVAVIYATGWAGAITGGIVVWITVLLARASRRRQ